MKKYELALSVLASVLALAGAAGAGETPALTFKFKTISVPNAQQTSTFAINNSGAVVGYYIDQAGAIHGLLLVQGKVTTVDDPKGTYGTEALGVNSSGAIVGQYFIDSGGDIRGFSYQNGQFTDVGTDCIESAASGINDNGEVVGFCTTSDNVVHGFLWNGKKYTILDYPGANNFTLPWGINNAGLITMQWIDSNGNYEAALYKSRTKEYSAPFTVPGAAQTYVHSINNAGDIVFSWDDSSGNSFGALLSNHVFSTFSDPKAPDYTRPDGINDKREIIGRYEPSGVLFEQGFVATY